MKKFTLYSLLLAFGLMAFSISASANNNKDNIFADIETLIVKSTAEGNLPAIIDDHGANRGAAFNGQYVFVASRQGGNRIYYWDINNPDDAPLQLDMTGVSGGTFAVNDVKVAGNHVFACNMVMPGDFKVYHWNGLDAQPSVLINYNTGTARLGDAFTVLGNPEQEAIIAASWHGGNGMYVWTIKNGQLESATPVIYTVGEYANTNFGRLTVTMDKDELHIYSGPSGVAVLGENAVADFVIEQSFFPGWPMFVRIFEYNGGRYLAYLHVKDNPASNMLYVLDISAGDDALEALQNLAQGTFANKVVHSVDLGSIPNGNASVSVEVITDPFGNLWLMGYAAGNGFVVQKLGDGFGLTLPFTENFEGEGDDTPDTWLPMGWKAIDKDGDGNNWYWDEYEGETYLLSASFQGGSNLTPDNWLMTPQIYLNELQQDDKIELAFYIASTAGTVEYRAEKYQVLISTTDDNPDSFQMIWEETLSTEIPNWQWQEKLLNLTQYAGEKAYIAFRHYGSTGFDRIALDRVEIKIIKKEMPEPLTLPFVENFDGEGDATPSTWLPEGWLNVDADDDGDTWIWAKRTTDGVVETFMRSFSYGTNEGGDFALYPDNYLISPAIAIPTPSGQDKIELLVSLSVSASTLAFRKERYEVLVSTTDTDLDSFTMIWEETFSETTPRWTWQDRKIDLTAYADEVIYVAIRHHGTSDLDAIALNRVEIKMIPDDVSVDRIIRKSALRLFPNPASDRFTISAESLIQKVIIMDVTGRIVRNIQINEFEAQLNTTGLNNGIYFITAYTENGVVVNKLQIQR